MDMDFDEFEFEEQGGQLDVCSSCGILLVHGNTTDNCSDPTGCGDFEEDEDDYGDEDLLEELNFDS